MKGPFPRSVDVSGVRVCAEKVASVLQGKPETGNHQPTVEGSPGAARNQSVVSDAMTAEPGNAPATAREGAQDA